MDELNFLRLPLAYVPLLILITPVVCWALIVPLLRNRVSIGASGALLALTAAAGYYAIFEQCDDPQCPIALLWLIPLLGLFAFSGLLFDHLLKRRTRTTSEGSDESQRKAVSVWAVLSAAFGMAQLMLLLVGSIAAIAFGHVARREIRTRQDKAGGGLALFGLVLGYLGLASTMLIMIPGLGAPPPLGEGDMRSPDMAASDAPFPGISRSALHALETNSVALWEGDSRSLCEQVPGAERATCEREATVAAETLERAGGPTHMQIDTVAREGRDSVVANWTVRARGEVVTVTTTAILTEDDWQVVNVEFGAEDAR